MDSLKVKMNEEILTTKKPINQYPVNFFGGGGLEIFIPSTPNYINIEYEQFSNSTFSLLVFRTEDSGKFFIEDNKRTLKIAVSIYLKSRA